MTKKVLFIDDDKMILELIQRMLSKEPYEVLCANSASEGLTILKNKDIDVVVTDMLMPEMTGLELLKIVKEKHPEVVRVVLSGFSQVGSIVETINNGDVYKYITKPWKVNEKSKKVIRDAIEYSDFLKYKSRKMIEELKLIEIVSEIDKPFKLIDKNENVLKESLKFEETEKIKVIEINEYYSLKIKKD